MSKREDYAELAKLKYDAEEAIARAVQFAEEHGLSCKFDNITIDRGGLGRDHDWNNSSAYC